MSFNDSEDRYYGDSINLEDCDSLSELEELETEDLYDDYYEESYPDWTDTGTDFLPY